MMRTSKLRYRLMFWIVGSVIAVLAIITLVSTQVTRRALEQEVQQRVQNQVMAQVTLMDGFLQSVARIPVVLANSTAVDTENNEQLTRARIREVVVQNPDIFGATVSFEPYAFHADQKYFGPYYYRSNNYLLYVQLGRDDNVYWTQSWYTGAQNAGRVYWTAPYFDSGGGKIWMTTASYPVVREGRFIGVATADVDIEQLKRKASEFSAGGKSYALLFDQEANLLVSGAATQETEMQTIQTWHIKDTPPEFQDLVNHVLASQDGVIAMSRDPFKNSPFGPSEPVWVIYETVPSTQWHVVVIASVDEMLAPVSRLSRLVAGVSVIGMILLAIITLLISNTITRPLESLRSEALLMAKGDLDRRVPIKTHDEVGAVGEAFNDMAAQLHDLIGNLEGRVAQRTAELERRSTQLATGAQVSRAASQVLDPDELLQRVVQLICERFELYYAAVFMLDESGQKAVLRAGTGDAGRIMRERGHALEVGPGSMVGWVCANKEARIALDVGEEPVRFANPLLPLTRSEMALPLRVGERVVGALDIQSVRAQAFDDNDITALQGMADQIAVALENARLFQQVQATIRELERANQTLTREGWQTLLQTQPTYFAEFHQPRVQPFTPQDAERLRHFPASHNGTRTTAIPLNVRDQTIGALVAEWDSSRPETSAVDQTVLETLTAQVAQALDSVRLFEESQRLAARQQLIGQISDRMQAANDMDTLVQRALQELASAIGASYAAIHLGTQDELLSKLEKH